MLDSPEDTASDESTDLTELKVNECALVYNEENLKAFCRNNWEERWVLY